MRKTLLTAIATGAVALSAAAAAGAASRTTAPDRTINLKITVTDTSAKIVGKTEWSKLVELPRGTYGRLVITNTGKKPHRFALSSSLPRAPKATIAPGKRIVVVADFLTRGDFGWAVDAGATHAGIFRIF